MKTTLDHIPYRKTLSFKLLLIFAVITFIGSALHVGLFLAGNQLFSDRLLQITNWEVAEEYARQLQPYASPVLSRPQLEEKAFELSRVNPAFDLYLLNENSSRAFSPRPDFCVPPSLDQIQRFLDMDGFPLLPIYGPLPDDCLKRKDRSSPFSAARITIAGKPGFVYVVLRGRYHREVFHSLGDLGLSTASVVFFVLLFVLTTLLALLFLYAFTSRFRRLTAAIGDFSRGSLSTRVADNGDDEMGLHAQVFNEMAGTIEQSIAKLEEGDSLRRQLIANVSHDLRTPIGAMQLVLETLKTRVDKGPDLQQKEFVQRAIANCGELHALVEDLFELSKLDARKTEHVQFAPLGLLNFLRGIVKKFVASAEGKDLAMYLDCPQDLPDVLVEERMLNRAISNLVENAIRYSAQGGELRISAVLIPGGVRITISDQGAGISEQDLPRIFERFYRGSRAASQEPSGTGLGLAIAKRIVELHGSSITVQSVLGQGTAFSFVLSLA